MRIMGWLFVIFGIVTVFFFPFIGIPAIVLGAIFIFLGRSSRKSNN